ncbi:MAG: ATP-binding protein, partial [Acidaminococcaceae bacterium]|nr:ATP-binding protein [Acidaminococcaceae bacterium]
RKLPIGVQSFESLRKDGFLYVDKTKYIYDLIHTSKQYFLSRPRRFGKSLFLSMFRAYWEGKKELFDGLEIVKLEADNPEAWQSYPVFYFDFNKDNFQRETALEEVLDAHLQTWEKEHRVDDVSGSLARRFQNLLKVAAERSGKRCVVLVDEYDKSLLEVLHDEKQEEHNKAVFKGFFSTLKSYDEYLQFVLITGVTKFSKVSIFSDLNQLKDISMNLKYASVCGITESEMQETFAPEIHEMARAQELTKDECLAKLRQTYDGYHFHPKAEGVYNPFSLLNALGDQEFRSYWFETGTPTFLAKKVSATGLTIGGFVDHTLYADELALSDYRAENPDPIPLLYQTGYLTICGYDTRLKLYTLGFPNEEVKYGFLKSLMSVYVPSTVSNTGKDVVALYRCIVKGEPDGVRKILEALFAGIPYTAERNPFEHYFESVLYVVFVLLGFYVKCEVHSSQGRADCIVETEDYVYIFEFKLDKSAEEALEQIEEKGYALPYVSDTRKVLKIGVSFDSAIRNIADWKARMD